MAVKMQTLSLPNEQPEDLSQYDCMICKDQRLEMFYRNVGRRKAGELIYDPNFPRDEEISADDFFKRVDPKYAACWIHSSRECICVERIRKQRQMDRLLATSNMSPKFKKRTFDNIRWLDPKDFKEQDRPEVELLMTGQRKAYETVLDYCINWESYRADGKGFGLLGDVGTAKTHLLAAKTNFLLQRGIQSVFVNTQDLFDEIRSCFEIDEKGKPIKEIRQSEILELLKKCEDLSLDDVGTEKPTEWVMEKYYNILNYRYEHELPTSFTSNNTLEELKVHLGKSYRRLIEPAMGRVRLIKGPSFEILERRKIRK
jgi:DNA replication protein DnaC